jgi:hypothetical protein
MPGDGPLNKLKVALGDEKQGGKAEDTEGRSQLSHVRRRVLRLRKVT